MAALQKFKLLATQCGVAPSPTRSPRSSPLLHLTRSPQKTTLRMLLTRGGGGRRRNSTGDRDLFVASAEMLLPCENKKMKKDRDSSAARQKLKDLFGSSPEDSSSSDGELENKAAEPTAKDHSFILGGGGMKSGVIVNSSSSPRPGFVGRFRYRALLKKSWRPPLETIPE